MTLENVYYETKRLLGSVAREALLEAMKFAFSEYYDREQSLSGTVQMWEEVHPLEQGKPPSGQLDENFIDYLVELENDAGGWYYYSHSIEEYEFCEHDEWKSFYTAYKKKDKK